MRLQIETHRKTAPRRWLATWGVTGLLVFLILAIQDWAVPRPPAWDVAIARAIQSVPGLTPLMFAVSWPGWSPQSWLVFFGVSALVYLRGVRVILLLLPAALTTELLVTALKLSVARVRPDATLVQVFSVMTSASFPSGHTTHYTVFLGYVGYLTWRYVVPGWERRTVMTVCAALILLVGPSRVYLGHHWPSDVIASYGLGLAMLSVLIAAEAWYRERLISRAEST